jgi:signal peptidase I
MANPIKQTGKKKISNIVTTAIAIAIGVFIIGLLFFKFVPGFGFYVVRSGSMAPEIGVGNIVFTGPVHDVKPGTIITFETGNEIVTHRVYSIDGEKITTKGDANRTPDPSPITMSDIKGVFLFQVPGLGYITQITSTKKGWFLLVIVPAALLAIFFARDILKEAFRNEKKSPVRAAMGQASLSAPEILAVSSGNPDKQTKTAKKSFFSFLMFNSGDRQPVPAAAERPSPVIPIAAGPAVSMNISSEAAYQNISRPEVTSSVSSERKARRPFYSFLLFDDEVQKATATASSAVLEAPAAVRPTVINYPPAPAAAALPETQTIGESPRTAPVSPEAATLSWLEFVRCPLVRVSESQVPSQGPRMAVPAEKVYIKSPNMKLPVVRKSVFSNQIVDEKVKGELRRLLFDY